MCEPLRAAAQAVFIGALVMFMANWLSHEDDQNSTKEDILVFFLKIYLFMAALGPSCGTWDVLLPGMQDP